MDRIIAARVYGIWEPDIPMERVKCSLCGLPYTLDRLTAVNEDWLLCPECFNIHAYFTMDPELYLEYLKTEAQKNAENLSGISRC